MSRPSTLEKKLSAHMTDGQILTRHELEASKFSPAGITRMLAAGFLTRVGSRGLILSSELNEGDNWTPAARFYGGNQDSPHGVVCLRSALLLHNLTDLTEDQVEAVEIAVPHSASYRPQGLNVRVFRLSRTAAFEPEGLQWREFGAYGIHVTTPARTVADLFNPRLPVGIESHLGMSALARLVVDDPAEAARVPRFCEKLGWERSVAEVYEAIVAGSSQPRMGGPR
jgi:predicted transcriptional regulator of viral defense system